jgi:hypothetical protein
VNDLLVIGAEVRTLDPARPLLDRARHRPFGRCLAR